MDYEVVASEFLRALRGSRSQEQFGRRLGSRSNMVYTWEAGLRFPTAAKTFWAAERVGLSTEKALTRFFVNPPSWLARTSPASADGIQRLLSELQGNASITEIAAHTDHNRYAVARWLKGQSEPRLPDFFRLIQALSLRLLDFIAAFIDPTELPSIRQAWLEHQAARTAAYELPWSHAVLRVLETEAYALKKRHSKGWIASRLGITTRQEDACLEVLERSGQIRQHNNKWQVTELRAIDTRQDQKHSDRLKQWWAEEALERLKSGAPGRFSYNLFTVSEADYERLQDLHLAYFRELRSIVADSAPAERVLLVNMQLLPLDVPREAMR